MAGMRIRSRHLSKHRGGNAATEFALIMPVLLIFIAGIVKFGHAFEVYSAVNGLSTRYAIAYADCYDTGKANPCNTEATTLMSAIAVQNMAPQLSVSSSTLAPTVRVFDVTMSTATLPALPQPTIKYPSPTGTSLTSTEISAAQVAIGSGQVSVIVTVSYTFALTFGGFINTAIPVNARTVSYTVAQQKT